MPRLPDSAEPLTLASLAAYLGVSVEGEASTRIAGFGSIGEAQPDELTFLRDARHVPALADSRACAVIAPPGIEIGDRPVVRSPRPAHDFSRSIERFVPRRRPPIGIAPGAHVDSRAHVDPTASVASGAVVEAGCRVGARTVVSANATLCADSVVGEDAWLSPGVVLGERTQVGDRVVLQPGVVLGGDGFGLLADESGRPVAMAQRGRVVVEDDVEIGANSTVDRATLDETRIRRGAKIDNLVQIAHNCDIGEGAVIVAQTGLSGGTVVGKGAVVMAQSGSAGHLRIGDGAFVGARAGLHRDVPDGARIFGSPQMEERAWHRVSVALKRLPDLLARVRRLERDAGAGAGEKDASEGDSGADF